MIERLISSSALIVALLLLRRLFQKTLSRRVQYALWGLVLARLLIPVSLPAVDFSVLTAARPVEQAVTQHIAAQPVYVPVARAPLAEHPTASDLAPEQLEVPEAASVWVAGNDNTAVQYKKLSVETLLSFLWVAGMAVLSGFFVWSNTAFYLRLKKHRCRFSPAEPVSRTVYVVPDGLIPSPCLFGNAIYLTASVANHESLMGYVLAHEETHARHLDPLWSFLRCVCLTVYWFDPLVWAAAACAKIDCELACDEAVLSCLGEQERISYGQTLLSLIPVKQVSNPLLAATTMTAGKKQIRDRILRIAHWPQSLMAAALAAVLLAGIVSACTFTGGRDVDAPERGLANGSASRPLTGEELRSFNEDFFSGPDSEYNIRNQFANPTILYETPADIDLYELFYCDGTTKMSNLERKAAFGVDSADELVCGAYKLTTDEIELTLFQYTGYSLAQTNRVGLSSFTYLEDFDAYYWMHGDTNYNLFTNFSTGTREGNMVKLYEDASSSSAHCVTLQEQSDGSYWFVSNTICEKPRIPTPLPDREPDVIIPLDDLEPYEAPELTLESHPEHLKDSYENWLDNWNIDGHNVVTYRGPDGRIYAGIRDDSNETMTVFLSGLGEDVTLGPYAALSHQQGFMIAYTTETEGTTNDTFYYFDFTEDGEPYLWYYSSVFLDETEVPTWGGIILDLDGDGTKELVSKDELLFQRDGVVCQADLQDLVHKALPALGTWDYSHWDAYSKRLVFYVCEETGADEVERHSFHLYFDGENLLVYEV